jgi:hypothetical protein
MAILTMREVCAKVHASDDTIGRLARQGKIEGAQKIGISWAFPERSLATIKRALAQHRAEVEATEAARWANGDAPIDKALAKLGRKRTPKVAAAACPGCHTRFEAHDARIEHLEDRLNWLMKALGEDA